MLESIQVRDQYNVRRVDGPEEISLVEVFSLPDKTQAENDFVGTPKWKPQDGSLSTMSGLEALKFSSFETISYGKIHHK